MSPINRSIPEGWAPDSVVRQCEVSECGNPYEASGMCSKHRARMLRHGSIEAFRLYVVGSMEERFWARVDKAKSCWLWTGRKSQGYGTFDVTPGRQRRAHRVSYELRYGPLSDKTPLDHTCHDAAVCPGGSQCPHRACVNPAHLEAVTHVENIQRRAAQVRRRPACMHGHHWTEESTYIREGGGLVCRLCARIQDRKRRRRGHPT